MPVVVCSVQPVQPVHPFMGEERVSGTPSPGDSPDLLPKGWTGSTRWTLGPSHGPLVHWKVGREGWTSGASRLDVGYPTRVSTQRTRQRTRVDARTERGPKGERGAHSDSRETSGATRQMGMAIDGRRSEADSSRGLPGIAAYRSSDVGRLNMRASHWSKARCRVSSRPRGAQSSMRPNGGVPSMVSNNRVSSLLNPCLCQSLTPRNRPTGPPITISTPRIAPRTRKGMRTRGRSSTSTDITGIVSPLRRPPMWTHTHRRVCPSTPGACALLRFHPQIKHTSRAAMCGDRYDVDFNT